jgi:hypothetical protein
MPKMQQALLGLDARLLSGAKGQLGRNKRLTFRRRQGGQTGAERSPTTAPKFGVRPECREIRPSARRKWVVANTTSM